MNLDKNITLAAPTKRFISFAIDFALGALVGFLLFAFWGTKGLFNDLGGDALWQQAMEFYGTSHLYNVEKKDDGSWGTDYEVLEYSVQPAVGQEKAGFECYLDATYLFYTDFLVNNENVDGVDGVNAKDYYGGVYFNTKIMGLPSDLTLVDIANPSTYTSANGYFQYALNDTQTAVDQEAKPVVAEAYRSLVNAEDRETLTKLYKLFVSGTNKDPSGIYYDAALLLSKQSHLPPIAKAYSHVNWTTNAVCFAIPLVLFFLLVPMVSPNGASVGKLIMNLAVVKNNGVKIALWQRLVRPLVVAILLSPFVFVPRTHQMFALMGCAILLFGDFAFALRDKTLRYRTLQDRLTGTILVDKKKSVILSTDAEAEQYAIDHNVVETVTKETIKVVDSATILSERSIIDLDVLANRDEDISSFDSFEERNEDK